MNMHDPNNPTGADNNGLPLKKYLKSWEVKKILGISESTLKRYREIGLLNPIQMVKGGNYKYDPDEVYELLRKRGG